MLKSKERFISIIQKYGNIDTFKKKEFLNVPMSFDIETTSFIDQYGQESSICYLWTFTALIKNQTITTYGRTLEEFLNFIGDLSKTIGINSKRKMYVFVHNLSFEFQFIRKMFEWNERALCVKSRTPIQVETIDGIIFRDSLVLSGMNLEKTADNLIYHESKKLVGDLDYSLLRHPQTYISPKELKYAIRDTEIVVMYIDDLLHEYSCIPDIPYTNTGMVRREVMEYCLKDDKYRWHIQKDLTMSVDEGIQAIKTYTGAITHANHHHVGKLMHNVASYDFTSSYPAVMVSEKQFAMGKGHKCIYTFHDIHKFNDWLDRTNRCAICVAHFTNLHEIPNINEHIISSSRLYEEDSDILKKDIKKDNGRIILANGVSRVYCTNVDLLTYEMFYEWDSITIDNIYFYKKGYLPKPLIQMVLKYYNAKTTLKGIQGKEVEYMKGKARLNSLYGMCVTSFFKPDYIITNLGEWDEKNISIDESINALNGSFKRFLFYLWGLQITSISRFNLCTGIKACGDDYLYCDTDSLKITNHEMHQDYFTKYNEDITIKTIAMCKHYGFPEEWVHPKTIKGKSKQIGVWDFEGVYDLFKTLGSKKYMTYHNGDSQADLTVAGLPKKFQYKKVFKGNIEKHFNQFDINLIIPPIVSGKNARKYIDDVRIGTITDYQGFSYDYIVPSGMYLYPTSFQIKPCNESLDEYFYNVLKTKGTKVYGKVLDT